MDSDTIYIIFSIVTVGITLLGYSITQFGRLDSRIDKLDSRIDNLMLFLMQSQSLNRDTDPKIAPGNRE